MTAKRQYDKEYRDFRAAVLKRDGHKCQMPRCGKSSNLQVHHIQRWADQPGIRYNEENGITLCKKCHISVGRKEDFFSKLFRDLLRRKYYEKDNNGV